MKKKTTEISDEDVSKSLDVLRKQQATLLPVDRPVAMGDVITMDVDGESDGQTLDSSKDYMYELNEGSQTLLPGFADKLIGLEKGKTETFTLSYPDDYEMKEIAGKAFKFSVTVKEVKEKQLPELDDEFAKALGSEDLSSLKDKILENMTTRAEATNKMEFEEKVVDAAVEQSEVIYPPVLVNTKSTI